MKNKKNVKEKILLVISGFCIGIFNGLFGGGGGMLCVPVLQKIRKIDDKKSHTTTIFIMLFLSVVSSIVYSFRINIDWFMTIFVTLGFAIGGILGTNLLNKMKEKYLDSVFAILIIIAGIKMVIV